MSQMRLRMWTYDLAREQAPTLDNLRVLAELSLNAGYNALGLYMEHRFAYPSAPWVHGAGAVTPSAVRAMFRLLKDEANPSETLMKKSELPPPPLSRSALLSAHCRNEAVDPPTTRPI